MKFTVIENPVRLLLGTFNGNSCDPDEPDAILSWVKLIVDASVGMEARRVRATGKMWMNLILVANEVWFKPSV